MLKSLCYHSWNMFFVSITPLMKMALDSLTIALVVSNLELFYDVEILLSLVCLVPMLEILNALVKCPTMWYFCLWFCGNNEDLSSFEQTLYWSFSSFHWWPFLSCYGLVEANHDHISLKWSIDLNIGIDHLGFECKGQHVWVRHKNLETRVVAFVTLEIYATIVNGVKQ